MTRRKIVCLSSFSSNLVVCTTGSVGQENPATERCDQFIKCQFLTCKIGRLAPNIRRTAMDVAEAVQKKVMFI